MCVKRFFSQDTSQPKLTLSDICGKPHIKAAMEKENITEAMLISANINLAYLNRFEESEIYWWYEEEGVLTFAEYVFTPGLQEAHHEILFCSTGLYALCKKHISIEQFLGLSKEAQAAMRTIFFDSDNDHGEYFRQIGVINRLFANNGFDFEQYNELSSCPNSLDHYLHGRDPSSGNSCHM